MDMISNDDLMLTSPLLALHSPNMDIKGYS